MDSVVEDSSIKAENSGDTELRYRVNDLAEGTSITLYLDESGYGEINVKDPVARFIGEKEREFRYSEQAAERILDADEEVWREFAEREFRNLLME